jgi:hypothetical protein
MKTLIEQNITVLIATSNISMRICFFVFLRSVVHKTIAEKATPFNKTKKRIENCVRPIVRFILYNGMKWCFSKKYAIFVTGILSINKMQMIANKKTKTRIAQLIMFF